MNFFNLLIIFLLSTIPLCQSMNHGVDGHGGNHQYPHGPVRMVHVSINDPDPFAEFNHHTRDWEQYGVDQNCIVVPCIRNMCPPRCGGCNNKNMCTARKTGLSRILNPFSSSKNRVNHQDEASSSSNNNQHHQIYPYHDTSSQHHQTYPYHDTSMADHLIDHNSYDPFHSINHHYPSTNHPNHHFNDQHLSHHQPYNFMDHIEDYDFSSPIHSSSPIHRSNHPFHSSHSASGQSSSNGSPTRRHEGRWVTHDDLSPDNPH